MNYFGLPGNPIAEFHAKVLETLLKWLKRRKPPTPDEWPAV